MNSKSIYADGGMNKQTGNVAWGCVVDSEGNDLIPGNKDLLSDLRLIDVVLPVGKRTVCISNFTDVKMQQNNGAELLAFIIGLRIASKSTKYKTLYTDSDLIYKYWSVNKKYSIKCKDCNKAKFIIEAIELRTKFEDNGGN